MGHGKVRAADLGSVLLPPEPQLGAARKLRRVRPPQGGSQGHARQAPPLLLGPVGQSMEEPVV
jgi:hypothetical protein